MQAAPSTERILVVDDEPEIVALVTYHLAKVGYRVATAATGQEALDHARRERPSLIVLDLMLPGISGFDVLEQLRADESTRDIAVLMLTARREEPDRIRGLRWAPTTISPSPSARQSSCCASARFCAAPAMPPP